MRPLMACAGMAPFSARDRKSTRLNSSHSQISYAVFCLKKKKTGRRDEVRSRWGISVIAKLAALAVVLGGAVIASAVIALMSGTQDVAHGVQVRSIDARL